MTSGGIEYVETRRGSRVRLTTDGSGPPVLAIHGLGGGAYFFEGCARRLAARYRTTAVDLPGTGRSTTTETPTVAGWVDDLSDVLVAVGAPAIVVGHSLGTILALEIWRARPELVRGLVFVGGLPAPRPAICERLRARAAAIGADGLHGWGQRVVPGVFSARTIAQAPETVALFARLFDELDASTYLRCLDLLVASDARDVVPTVTVPSASISGDQDQYAPPDDVTAFVRQLPAGTPQVVLPDVGHLPFFEAPEAFARALEEVVAPMIR